MSVREINSINNEYIKRISKLKDKKYRDEERCFLIEGEHLIEEAIKNNAPLKTVFITDISKEVKGIDNILVSEAIIQKLSSVKAPQKIIGVCGYLEKVKVVGERFLILDGIQDPGNLGTLIRTALGFGIDTIVASLDTVDIYNDKVIRSTQGAIFNINYIKGDLKEIIFGLKNKGVEIIGTSLQSSVYLEEVNGFNKYALILGNEGNGVREDILKLADINVKIKICEKLESLNVAVAGAIVMNDLYSKIKGRD